MLDKIQCFSPADCILATFPFLPSPAPHPFPGCSLAAAGRDEERQVVNGVIFWSEVSERRSIGGAKGALKGPRSCGRCDGQGGSEGTATLGGERSSPGSPPPASRIPPSSQSAPCPLGLVLGTPRDCWSPGAPGAAETAPSIPGQLRGDATARERLWQPHPSRSSPQHHLM